MDARMSKDAEAFLDRHSGLSPKYVQAHAEEAARRNEALIAAEMRELAEHPLDLTGVPHADEVLAVLGEGIHPLVLNDFFTKPSQAIGGADQISVRDWLLRGGDVEPVLHHAKFYPLST